MPLTLVLNLGRTHKRLQESNLTHVTYIQADVQEVIQAPQQADLVYARLLLMHLKEPGKAIQNLVSLLKPNGMLVLEEPITSTCHVVGDKNQLQGMVKTVLKLGKHLGLDYDIGLRLKDLVDACALKIVSQTEYQNVLDPTFARSLLTLAHAEWGARAISEGILSEQEYLSSKEEINALDKPFRISKHVYITARKP